MKWRFRYYVDGNVEIPHGAEMHASTVNKVHRTRNSEKEAEVTQSQAILEYLAFGNARERESRRMEMVSAFRRRMRQKLKKRPR